MLSGKLQVIPAVDLLRGEAVRLERGDFRRVAARADPEALVHRFAAAGARLVHLVDLDGARTGQIRPDVVRRLAAAARPAAVQASGGIRSTADAECLLEAGAARVVAGTAVFANRGALETLAEALSDRLVVAVDVRAGRVAIRGWEDDTGADAAVFARRCAAAGVKRLMCTAIERDGMLSGPDLGLLRLVRGASDLPLLAAGGIRSPADLDAVDEAGCEGAVVGRALLDGSLPLSALAPPSGQRPVDERSTYPTPRTV